MKVKIKKIGVIIKHSINPFARDALWAYHPVLVEKGKTYYLFYTGKSFKKGISHYLLLAKSNDLVHWTKVPEEVLTVGKEKAWDSDFLAHNFVFKDGEKYFMLYDGSKIDDWFEEIGLAESTDLVHWKKYEQNPIFKRGKNWWEKRHVSRACIFKEKGIYYLYYAGHDGKRERIGLAKGRNLTSLKRFLKDPVLDLGKKGEWDEASISDPRVFKHKGRYLMFYSGMDSKMNERVGLAESKDLIHWEKNKQNPILDVSKNNWDSISASRAHIATVGKDFYVLYSGKKNKFFYNIGMAKMEIK